MKSRILSAIVLLLICVPLLLKGESYFAMLTLVVGVLCFKELYDLRLKEKKLSWLISILAYLAVGFLILNNYQGKELVLTLDYRILTFITLGFLIPLVIIGDNKKYNLLDALYLIGCILFIGFSFNLMIVIRNYSLTYFIYYLLIAIFTDTFALVGGKLIGKNKLAPTISPNKTVEGFVVGTAMGSFVGILYYLTVINSSVSFINLLIVTVTLSMIGELGDLVFSQIKRFYEQKDFSNIIPGHGGMLDMFDSLIFIIISVLLFINII
jgi:phosphatidate cytidylyltransferase